jgi:DNA-binding transcriptional regulator YiaG
MTNTDLRAWRKARKMTQPQAALFFRCSVRAYKNWELNAVPVPALVALVIELTPPVAD